MQAPGFGRILLIVLLAAVLPACGSGGGGGSAGSDSIPPAAVLDLAAGSGAATWITLTWTAPGDDAANGTATAYDLRRAATPILNLADWDAATPVSGAPAPSAGGTPETFTITGLTENTSYSFALRARDDAGNLGALSGSCTRKTTLAPPGKFAALTVSPTRIDLHWIDLSADESGYLVERSLDGVAYAPLATLPPDSEYYPDPGRDPSTAYSYRVSSLHTTGEPGIARDTATTLPATGGWRMFGRDAHHTSYPRDETGVPAMSPAWSVSFGQDALHPVVVEDGRVFATAHTRSAGSTKVWARDLSDGSPAWEFDYGNVSRLGDPAVFQGRLFVPVLDPPSSHLSVRDAATGAPLWSAPFPAQFPELRSPTLVGHRVYMNAGTFGGLYAWDAVQGTPLFANTSLATVDGWSPLYLDGKIYSYDGAAFRAHHPTTGANLRSLSYAAPSLLSREPSCVAENGRIFAVAKPDLVAVDAVTHSLLWSVTGFDYHGVPAVADGVVYALHDGTLHARDAATGALLWTYLGDCRLRYPPVVANNHVYVSSDYYCIAVNLGNQTPIWNVVPGGWTTISDDHLLIAQADGTLSAYTLTAGVRPSESVAPATPTGLVATPGAHSRVDLTWTAPPDGVIGYLVERSSDGTTWDVLIRQGYETTSAAESGVAAGVPKYYRVSAVNAAGTSAPSAVAAAVVPATTETWGTFAGNPLHTGDCPGEMLSPPPAPFWDATYLFAPLNSIAMENLRVYMTFEYPIPYLLAVDEGGLLAWYFDFAGGPLYLGPPAVDKGRIFVLGHRLLEADGDPKLFCLDAASGRPLWTGVVRNQTGKFQAPTVVGDTVFVSESFNGGMAAFRVSDGRSLFVNTEIAPVQDGWTPAWQAGTLYSLSAGKFRAHDPATGAVQWTTTVPWSTNGIIGSVPVLGSTHAYFSSPPSLRAVNLTTHANDWTVAGGGTPTTAYFGTPALSGGKVFVYKGQVDAGGVLEVRDANGLGLLWTFAGDGALRYPPVVANGYVYVSSDSNTYAVNLATQAQVWTLAAGGWLAVSNGRLYIAHPSGTLSVHALQ